MKLHALGTALLLTVLASSAFAQETTRDDFKEFCQTWQGRWVGDVTWVADWPGFGKRGEKVTAYWEGKVAEDGNVLIGKFFGGKGSSTGIVFFDQGAKRIKWLWIESGGRVGKSCMYKKDGNWVQEGSAVNPDGAKSEYISTITITDDGNKHTWTGKGTMDGKKIDDQNDVWRRVSK
jgi:hypothetical protein